MSNANPEVRRRASECFARGEILTILLLLLLTNYNIKSLLKVTSKKKMDELFGKVKRRSKSMNGRGERLSINSF